MKFFKQIILFVFASLFALSVQAGPIESAFSPNGGAEEMIVRTINSARNNIRMAAFSFTNPNIIRSLVDAKRRGVDVKIVVDKKANTERSCNSAMNVIVNAGIPLRTISTYKIHHDKYIVVDGEHVQTGSFNYTKAAANSNSENVVVIWNDVPIASKFLRHWESRWNQGQSWYCPY